MSKIIPLYETITSFVFLLFLYQSWSTIWASVGLIQGILFGVFLTFMIPMALFTVITGVAYLFMKPEDTP